MNKCNCDNYSHPLKTLNDIQNRMSNTSPITSTLKKVTEPNEYWISVCECSDCGKYWAKEYPYSEAHGGGSPCYYIIDIVDPHDWIKKAKGITHNIRKSEERN